MSKGKSRKTEFIDMLYATIEDQNSKDFISIISYWGDIAFTFLNGQQLTLPISEHQMYFIREQLQIGTMPNKFLSLISLDNRALTVHMDNVADVIWIVHGFEESMPSFKRSSDYFDPMSTSYWELVGQKSEGQREVRGILKDNVEYDQRVARSRAAFWGLTSGVIHTIDITDNVLALDLFKFPIANNFSNNFVLPIAQLENEANIRIMTAGINYYWVPWWKVAAHLLQSVED